MNFIYSSEKIILHTYHQKDYGTWTIFLISKHDKCIQVHPSLSPTFRSFGKDNRLGKKPTLIPCGKGGEATRVLRINSLQKTNENNAVIFSSIFTSTAFRVFKLTRKNFAMEFEPQVDKIMLSCETK